MDKSHKVIFFYFTLQSRNVREAELERAKLSYIQVLYVSKSTASIFTSIPLTKLIYCFNYNEKM